MNERLKALSDAGVSIWLDDLSRDMINDGVLDQRITEDSVVGVTTNPTIFAAALTTGNAYDEQLASLGDEIDVEYAIKALTTTDVRNACDKFADVYRSTGGYDGRVSIEVDPTLANNTGDTIAQAADLHQLVDRENVLIKIPATEAGLPAIRQTIAAGISVNVTLIFSEDRYRAVTEAYLSGLEDAASAGKDLSTIHSVASFFVSRVDSEVDKRLEKLGRDDLKSKAGIANAVVAYGAYEEIFGGERFAALKAKGANAQRPLWASTGTKDPALSDTLYVTNLVAEGVVNTMPVKTLEAFADHGEVGPSVAGDAAKGQEVLDQVTAAGVDLPDVFKVLEEEGVAKFVQSWNDLTASVESALATA